MRYADISDPEREHTILSAPPRTRGPTLEEVLEAVAREIADGSALQRLLVIAGAGSDPVARGVGIPPGEVLRFASAFDPARGEAREANGTHGNDGRTPAGAPRARFDTRVHLTDRDRENLPSMERPTVLVPRAAQPHELMLVVDGRPDPFAAERIRSVLRRATPFILIALEARALLTRVSDLEDDARRTRGALYALPDPVVLTDPKGEALMLNREAARLVGQASGSSRVGAAVDAALRNRAKLEALVRVSGPPADRDVHLDLIDPDDAREMPMVASSRVVAVADDDAAVIVTQLHDLSPEVENRRLAQELRALNARLETRVSAVSRQIAERNSRLERQRRDLEKASRLKSEFLAMISDELRTPINIVLGYTALLEDGLLGELGGEQRRVIHQTRRAAHQLLSTVSDILDLARVEAGLVRVERSDVDLRRCLASISHAIREDAEAKSLTYVLDIAADVPTIRTDEARLRQIVQHLLGNAVKFTESGSITLRASRMPGKGRVRVSVEDTGIGIAPDDLATIFEDFAQADQSATRRYRGAGLGLAICRQLADLLDGRLHVASAVGRGTKFTLELPVIPDDGYAEDGNGAGPRTPYG